MKSPTHLITASLLAVATTNALCANPKPIQLESMASFESWTRKNILCQSTFISEVTNTTFLKQAKALGMTVNAAEPDEVPGGTFVLPKPLMVFGFSATRITYWADSGSEFYVEVDGSPAALKKAMKAKTLPRNMRSGYVAGIPTKPPTAANPYPAIVFIRGSQNPGKTEVGCRTFDY